MVLVAQAVVYKRAVVIEPLHALVAVITVHGVLGTQVLAINANVVKMKLFIN